MRRVTESHTISLDEIRTLAEERFGDMIKGVVDLERRILLLDADLHADQEASLESALAEVVSLRSNIRRIDPADHKSLLLETAPNGADWNLLGKASDLVGFERSDVLFEVRAKTVLPGAVRIDNVNEPPL